MLTGVASLIADRTGGVMSQLSGGAATQNALSDTSKRLLSLSQESHGSFI